MERVRGYLNDEDSTLGEAGVVGAGRTTETTPSCEERNVDDDETRSFLSSGRIDGRSSDAKSIGSLSQHLFESDDNEDEKYYGTCNGYTSQPGSKSNLLLCSECDLRSRTCTYRPQTPSQLGRFVEERIDRQTETRSATVTKQERRAGTSIVKSPMRMEGSPRYWRDDEDRGERRAKSIATSSAIVVGTSRPQDQESTRTVERQRDSDSRHHEATSPSLAYKSPVRGGSPRYHDVDQRTWTRRNEQREDETDEGKSRWTQERHHDSRSPVKISDRSPRLQEIDRRVWTRRRDQDEEVSEDQDYLEESEDSPPCPICNGSNGISRCAHCNLSSDQDDADLICFRCQMSAEEETTSVEGSVCQKCENNCQATRYGTNGSCQTTSSSSEGTKYHVDAVVKIQVNNRSIDVDSDETIDSDRSNNRDSGEAGTGSIDRLETIVEAKNDTASENGEDNGSKINGQPRTKYLNYMIVLLL